MAISDTLQSMKENLQTAYDKLQDKGATIPTNKNLENLAGAIETVPTGTDTSDATAQASDILAGKTAYVASGKVTGTIQTETADVTPSKGKQTILPSSGKLIGQVVVEPIPGDYVIPSGTQQITENGTYDVSGKASAVVNVPSGVEEVATASAMNALLVEENVGKYYKFTGTTDSNFVNGDLYLVEGGGAVIKEFTIGLGVRYQYEEGMTWTEWVASSYNTIGWVVKGNYISRGNGYVIDGDIYALSTDLVHTGDYGFGKI